MYTADYAPIHFQILLRLHKSQDSDLATKLMPNDIPLNGVVVSDNNDIQAIGFLRLMEGEYAMLDTVVTNGKSTSAIRHEAFSLLVDKLLEKARNLGIKAIISHTTDVGVLSRAKSLGFVETDQRVISLVLKS